ncbi:junctional adhesion molecule C-like [Antedon mediterranea]|uniref:junctional adhesion molecule C-like n=1 Tax=Antedon mediterranea TaxID=105859 RepID=UPI003AF772E7
MHLLVGVVIFLVFTNEAHCQLVTTSDQEANEGDAEVGITCDYSQFTSTAPYAIQWDELNDGGVIINPGIVNTNKVQSERFRLETSPGKANLVMSQPLRKDSQRIFQCQIKTLSGDIQLSNPSILTVYYLNQPLLDASASTVYEGQSVTFTCSKPDGYPIPDIIWYRDGQTVNTDNPSRYEIANSSTELVLKIRSATDEDGGRYTCKAGSDQFKGDDARTSEGKQLIVIGYYISINFTSDGSFATCSADGYPRPLSVLILQDGEVVKKRENTATIEINDEICQSSLTCNAENGKLNQTAALENCGPGHTVFKIQLLQSYTYKF